MIYIFSTTKKYVQYNKLNETEKQYLKKKIKMKVCVVFFLILKMKVKNIES